MKTYNLVKTYTQLLDVLILSFLALSVTFLFTDNIITDSFTSRRGVTRTMVVSWQSLFLFATFCLFLRHVVRKFQTA